MSTLDKEHLKCEVCEIGEPIGVAAMTIGAMSIRYCKKCHEQGAEPKWAVQWMVEDSGGYDKLADWAKEIKYFENGEYKGIEIVA